MSVNMKRVALLLALLLISTLMAAVASAETETDAPDYSAPENWAIYGRGTGDADVFFICPTVDMGKAGNLNMSMDDEKTKTKFLGAAEMELGIYDENAVVYAPYYRQATFPIYAMPVAEREPYLATAYTDIRASFDYYLAHCDPARPLILAGFSQGGELVIRLMKDCFGDEALQKRLVAAYVIGWRLTREDTEAFPQLVPAQGEDDCGCIVVINSESPDTADSLLVPAGMQSYGINPLNWRTDSTYADASLNEGACFTDYSGEITKEIPAFTGCSLDETRGTLKCPDVNPADYANSMFPDGVYHLYDYQFFYRNLQRNVSVRIEAWKALQ